MLKVGDIAPPFVVRATDGRIVSLGNYAGRALIIYFFHKAFTPNCTIETRGFRFARQSKALPPLHARV